MRPIRRAAAIGPAAERSRNVDGFSACGRARGPQRELLLPDGDKLWVFTRTLGDRRLLVVANMTSTMVGVPMAELPDLTDARLVLTNLPEVTGDVQTLEPWESRIYELQA